MEKLNELSERDKHRLLLKKNNEGKLVVFTKLMLTDDVITRKLEYCIACISVLEQEGLVKQIGVELSGVLCKFVDQSDAAALRTIAEHFLDQVKQEKVVTGQSFPVLGAVLSCLEASVKSVVGSDGDDFTGPEYRSKFVNQICNVRWSSSTVIPLGEMFKDMTLTQPEMYFVIEKLCGSLSLVKVDQIPSIVDLLVLSASKGHHKRVIAGLTEFFNNAKPDSESEMDLIRDIDCEMSQAEGLSLLRISFAVKHDLELGKAITQHIKGCKKMSVFSTGLGLWLSENDRFSEQILASLKSSISKALKSSKLWGTSKFIHNIMEDPVDVKILLKDILNKSLNGWDYVIEGLINLGFLLLDSNSEPEGEIGYFLLEECFRFHLHCRASVMTSLLHRIVTSSPISGGQPGKLLSCLAKRSIQLLLAQTSKIKDSLSNVPLVPIANARHVLRAVIPVMRYDTPLRDNAILIFRKSLFSKNPDSRRIAVFGLTEMMRKFKVGENYSQSTQLSCSQVQVHLMVTDDINEAVSTEILLLLRRGLTQQGNIRSDIYDRLGSVLSQNYKLYPMLLQLLEEQISSIWEADTGILPPVNLASCITVLPDSSVLREPLPHLLRAVFAVCYTVRGRDPEEVEKLSDMLESIVNRAAKCDLEDWDLDKAAEFTATGVGSRNLVTALTLIGSMEVLLEHVLVRGLGTVESGEKFKKIFRLMFSVHELLGEKQGGSRGKKPKAGASFFSLSAVECLLQYLIVNDMSEHEDFVSLLKTVTGLTTWGFGVLAEHLKRIQTEASDPEEGKELSFTLGAIAKSLIAHLKNSKSLYRDQASSLLEKSVRVMIVQHPAYIEEFCETATSSNSADAFRDKILELFQTSIEAEDFTESQHLLTILDMLFEKFDGKDQLDTLLERLLDNSNLTSSFAKEVVSILLTNRRRSSDDFETHLSLAKDFLCILGDIETEDEDSTVNDVKYKFVTDNSVCKLAQILVISLDAVLSDLEWAIQQSAAQNDNKSDLICSHFLQITSVLSLLLTCKIPRSSPAIDPLSRLVKKFYTTFTLLIKRESTKADGILRGLERLSKLVGSTLNQKLYSFLYYLEQTYDTDSGKKTAATIRKQAIAVPGIIYAVEQCERNLIILSKKTRTDLMEHFKRSTARDFKIRVSVLQNKFDKPEVAEPEEQEQPTKKRKKGKKKALASENDVTQGA